MSMRCRSCGSDIPAGSFYCPDCGTRIVGDRARLGMVPNLILIYGVVALIIGLFFCHEHCSLRRVLDRERWARRNVLRGDIWPTGIHHGLDDGRFPIKRSLCHYLGDIGQEDGLRQSVPHPLSSGIGVGVLGRSARHVLRSVRGRSLHRGDVHDVQTLRMSGRFQQLIRN